MGSKAIKVALVSTYTTGGAGIACMRLEKALRQAGVETSVVVRPKGRRFSFYWERLVIWLNNRLSRKNLFALSIANCGEPIAHLKAIQEADVIHLHWVNQGMLSLQEIAHLAALGKPIVWTLHDMWAFTAICHYAGDCTHFHTHCHHCPLLIGGGSRGDLAARTFGRKKRLLAPLPITYITCSRWLGEVARESTLLGEARIVPIPNPIDTTLFAPQPTLEARKRWGLPSEKRLLLFGAMKLEDTRKGLAYLIEACQLLAAQHPELSKEVAVVTFGATSSELQAQLPFELHTLNFLSNPSDIAQLYSAVDLFVTPSIEDNLPNTIMEAMACATPCVGFDTGGIPEMISHLQSGYVASYKCSQSLCDGIAWCLTHNGANVLGNAARERVVINYCEEVVAEQYNTIYNQLIHHL